MTSHRRAVWSAALALVLVVLQLTAVRTAGSSMVVRVVLPATVAAVTVVLWPHRRQAGVWVIYVGLAANLAAIVANGGLMPIRRDTVVAAVGEQRALAYRTGEWIGGSKDVLLGDGEGRVTALGDQLVIPLGRGGVVASPGDLVVWSGIVILACEASWRWHRRHREKGAGRTRAGVRRNDAAEGGATTLP